MGFILGYFEGKIRAHDRHEPPCISHIPSADCNSRLALARRRRAGTCGSVRRRARRGLSRSARHNGRGGRNDLTDGFVVLRTVDSGYGDRRSRNFRRNVYYPQYDLDGGYLCRKRFLARNQAQLLERLRSGSRFFRSAVLFENDGQSCRFAHRARRLPRRLACRLQDYRLHLRCSVRSHLSLDDFARRQL